MKTEERISKTDLEETKVWLKSAEDKVPPRILHVILVLLSLFEKLEPLAQRYKKILALLAQSWDLTPASEKVTAAKAKPGKAGEKTKPHRSCLTRRRVRKKKTKEPPPEPQSPVGSAVTQESVAAVLPAPVNPEFESENGATVGDIIEGTEKIKIWDLKFIWTGKDITLQTKTNLRTGKKLKAKVEEAFEGGKFTFGTMASLAILHVGYQMPLTRMVRFLTTKEITLGKSTIYGFLVAIADVFFPIFMVLCEQLAKEAKAIEMDDFNTRINKRASDLEALRAKPKPTDGERLLLQLDDTLGLVSPTVSGKRHKTKANLTVLSGLIVDNDKTSRIVLKLTHIGGAGDLLGNLITRFRDAKNLLWVVSDLASSNTPRGAGIAKFSIRQQACIWHARRRFWQARDYDDECWHALRCFQGMADIEARILAESADEKEIMRLRGRYSAWFFKRLIKVCQELLKKWGKESVVGEAAEYVLANEHTLRQFLKHPHLLAHNNRVERYGRPEKLMLSASKFRDRFSGRVVYDLISTVMATSCAAGVDFHSYTVDVLKNRDLVRMNPVDWTPRAWAKRQQTV